MDLISVGFALTGSYCTFSKVIPQMKNLKDDGYNVIPIMSENAANTDTRFGTASDIKKQIEEITGNKIIASIKDAEPIGPKKIIDALIIAPCTGNTRGKLASGITDSSVTMAAKAILRNEKPVIIAVSTNDGLSGSAKNIGKLLNVRNIYFVPFGQDDYINKPRSIVAYMDMISSSLKEALNKKQIQPIIKQKR